ncbi:MAG: PAS domain S-box protein, partial [Bacteroidia bacterium]|nr:PAS domain S-box protein [Bacteroidia bacterium]
NDIITLYDRISSDKENDKVEFYSDNLKRWYDVKVLKVYEGLLITLFEDITYLKSLQTELDNTGYLLIENERLTQLTKSLAQSEESYKSLFDYTIVAIYVLDENGIFIDVNSAATRMYQYKKEEMIGYTPEMLSAPGRNDIEKTLRYIQQAYKGEPQRFEWWGLRKNGEVFPKDVVLNKGLYCGKDVVLAMARDNTELFQTLDALKESEDKFRSLTEQLPVGVYRTTIDGKIVYTNMALVRILDYESVDEFLKINVNQLYPDPANRQNLLKKAGKSAGILQSEFQLRKKNGELIWVRDNSRLIYDKKGNPEYYDGVLEDITEERNSQLAVKKNEANLKAIIENTLENIWSVNSNYEIQYVNEVFASSFRQTFGTLLKPGVNVIDALPEFLKPVWKERYDRALKNEHYLFEDKIDINDTSIYIEVAMNPIVIDGTVVGISAYGKSGNL